MPGRFLAVRAALGGVVMLVAPTILGAHAETTCTDEPRRTLPRPRPRDDHRDCRLRRAAALWTKSRNSQSSHHNAPSRKSSRCKGTSSAVSRILTELQPTASGVWEGKFRDPILGGAYSLDISRGNAKSGPVLMVQRYSAPPFFTRSMARAEAWGKRRPTHHTLRRIGTDELAVC